MLVRRLPTLALLAGLPILLANCSSDSNGGGGTAGTPSSSAGSGSSGSPAIAGAPAAGAPAAGAASVGGGGSSSVGGGGSASVAGGGSTSTGGTGTGGGGAGGSSAGGAGKAGGGSGGTTGGTFTLTSAEITAGVTFPEVYTCDGGGGSLNFGTSPSFKWANPPAGTMSYAFFMIDWSLTMGASSSVNGYHSTALNIPTTITEVPKGWTTITGAKVINGGYAGPCPNAGDTDQYHMIIMAMPMASYTTTGSSTAGVKAAYDQLKPLAIGTAEIIAPYKRK